MVPNHKSSRNWAISMNYKLGISWYNKYDSFLDNYKNGNKQIFNNTQGHYKKNMMLPEKLSDWQKALPAVNTFLFNFNIQKMNSSGIEQYEWNTFGSFEEK